MSYEAKPLKHKPATNTEEPPLGPYFVHDDACWYEIIAADNGGVMQKLASVSHGLGNRKPQALAIARLFAASPTMRDALLLALRKPDAPETRQCIEEALLSAGVNPHVNAKE